MPPAKVLESSKLGWSTGQPPQSDHFMQNLGCKTAANTLFWSGFDAEVPNKGLPVEPRRQSLVKNGLLGAEIRFRTPVRRWSAGTAPPKSDQYAKFSPPRKHAGVDKAM